jgi:hypothetical protein
MIAIWIAIGILIFFQFTLLVALGHIANSQHRITQGLTLQMECNDKVVEHSKHVSSFIEKQVLLNGEVLKAVQGHQEMIRDLIIKVSLLATSETELLN